MDTTAPVPPAPPAPPLADPSPPWVDEGREGARIVGGAAAATAARLGVDALWVRLGLVVLALLGGIGLVVYAGLWLVLVVGARLGLSPARFLGGALLVVGVPLLVAAAEPEFVTGPVAVVALLTGLTLALWAPRGIEVPPAWTPPTPTRAEVVAVALDDSPPRRARRPRRPPSMLGRWALGLAAVTAAAGALIDQLNGGRLHPEQWLGAAAVVCGLGLLVGTVRGYARWLVVPAAAFAASGYVAGAAADVGVGAEDLMGDRWAYIDQMNGPSDSTLRSIFGSAHIEVAGDPPGSTTVDVHADVVFGNVNINAVAGVAVEVRADVDHGEVWLDGVAQPDGVVRVGPEGEPDVVVQAHAGRGDVQVRTYSMETTYPDVTLVTTGVGQLTYVTEGVGIAADGTVVLGEGEAAIDPDDQVLFGTAFPGPDDQLVVSTLYGDFTLLPRGLLVTPYGEVPDLVALRQQLPSATVDATVPAGSVPAGLTDTTLGG